MSTEVCPVPPRPASVPTRAKAAVSLDVWRNEWKTFLTILVVFLGAYFLPVGSARSDNAVLEAFHLLKWYAHAEPSHPLRTQGPRAGTGR